jgi:hypothetical protein
MFWWWMVDGTSPEIAFRDVVVVGGGCYGSFYVGQMERARARGKAAYRRLLVVDHDPGCRVASIQPKDEARHLVVKEWDAFFDAYLDAVVPSDPSEPPDAIVPSPLMPHLMYQWLVRRARARWPGRVIETRPVTLDAGTPYDRRGPDGTRYVSFADWLCPTHCIEPATCPVIRAPRTWEMADALTALTRRVGMFDVSEVLAGDNAVAAAGHGGTPIDVLVATVSSCHGAASLLYLG